MVRSASDSTPVIFLQQAFLCTLPRVRFLLTKCHWRVTPRCCLVRSCSWKQNAKAKTKRKEEASQKIAKTCQPPYRPPCQPPWPPPCPPPKSEKQKNKVSPTRHTNVPMPSDFNSVISKAKVLVVYCIFYLDIHSRNDIHWYKRVEGPTISRFDSELFGQILP